MVQVVLDSSSAVFMAKLGLFRLLEEVEFLMPPEIEEETEKGVNAGYREAFIRKDLIERKKIKVVQPQNPTELSIAFKLKGADLSVLALAKEKKCLLATEDEQIRKVAQVEGITVTNTGALLYYVYKKQNGEPRKILNLLDLLERWGYRKETIISIKEKILLEDR